MYSLYETNYTKYNQKMKEMVTNYGIRRPEGCIDTGLNCTFEENILFMNLFTHSCPNLNFLIKFIHYLFLLYSCIVTIANEINYVLMSVRTGDTVFIGYKHECNEKPFLFLHTYVV